MTQSELGKALGTGQVSIANYEKGSRFPGEKMIVQMADALGISIDLLFSDRKTSIPVDTDRSFRTEELIRYLLNESLDDCLRYTVSWMASGGFSLQEGYQKILAPVLHETGLRWQGGSLSILEEHLISERVRELISLTAAYARGDGPDGRKVKKVWMGLCAPSDKHDLGILMLSQLLRGRGWKTFFLGPDVPVNDLTSFVNRYKPDLIGISIVSELFRDGLQAYLQNLDSHRRTNCPVLITGRGFPQGMEEQYSNTVYFSDILDRGYDYAIGLEGDGNN